MKTTVVPAQVTTVEDKIAGNLSFSQLMLLTVPVFLDGALFVLFPPLFKLTAPKRIIGVSLALICMLLAIRIKGKLLFQWIAVIGRFNFRPRHYVFNKNDSYLRGYKPEPTNHVLTEQPVHLIEPKPYLPLIPTNEMVRLELAVADPQSRFHFKTDRKGALRVYIHKVKKESL